jgi:hypothetical protein
MPSLAGGTSELILADSQDLDACLSWGDNVPAPQDQAEDGMSFPWPRPDWQPALAKIAALLSRGR